MGRPEPQELQRALLKVIYDRFQDDGKWAPFTLIDRRFRRLAPGHDAIEVARGLPSGLLQPPLRAWEREPAGPFRLTLAGVIAATERSAKPWEQAVFLAAVRLAAEIELAWDGTDDDPRPCSSNARISLLAPPPAWT